MTDTPTSGTSDSSEHLDAAQLRAQTDQMIDALTDPRYIEAVRAVRSSPDESRLAEAAKNLSPDALRELGVPIPAGMRISSRYFEPDLPGEVELGDVDEGSGIAGSLNKAAPGLLDRLRREEPELFKNLTIPTSDPGGIKFAAKHCACGGAPVPRVPFNPVVCGGTGVTLPF